MLSVAVIALYHSGSSPKPGEISLAHGGVLFLDELPEFSRHVLEVLRQPLESGEIHLSRARAQASFPARFQLVAAMNPCPCGYQGNGDDRCRCTPDQVRRYRERLSGPLLDRIDLQVAVLPLKASELQSASTGETSAQIAARVAQTRRRQLARQGKANAQLGPGELDGVCQLGEGEKSLLTGALEKLGLSPRAYHRVLRVARTLADMSEEERVSSRQIAEALSYRHLDRPV